MAIQKHNTYYDASKPNSGIYFYDQAGNSTKLPISGICSAGKGIDLTDNTISYTGKDEPVLIGDSNITATSSVSGNHTQWNLFVNPTPIVTDTSLTGENGITAHTTDISGQWIIGMDINSANNIKKIPDILEDINALTSKSANWETSYNTLTANSASWDASYDTLTSNSANWESSYNTLKTNSGDWLKEEDIAEFITKEEVNTVSSVLTGQTDYLSGVIDNKLDTDIFDTYTANADVTPYSGFAPIKVENHVITLTANYALSADVYSKDKVYNKNEIDEIVEDIEEQLAKLGFHRCSPDEVKANGVPDEVALDEHGKLSTNLIYLVKDDTAPTPDQYREWIYEDDGLETVTWTCIGDTTISLEGYATEEWVNENFSAADDLTREFEQTSAWVNDTFYDKTETSAANEIQTALDKKLDTSAFESVSGKFVSADFPRFTADLGGNGKMTINGQGNLSVINGGNLTVTDAASLKVASQSVAAIEFNTVLSAFHSNLVQGIGNVAVGAQAMAQGISNSALDRSLAQGNGNYAATASIAQGHLNSASNYSQVFGWGNAITNTGMAIGKYNKTTADTSFVIGNGTNDSNRSDLFIIKHDGTVSSTGDFITDGKSLADVYDTVYNNSANYYTKDETDEAIDLAIDDISATIEDEYAKKSDIPEVPEYTAANQYIKVTDDYGISGYDWTPELNTKVDNSDFDELTDIVNDIGKTVQELDENKLDVSAFDNYSAHALDDYYKKSETSAAEEIQNALDEKQDNLTDEQLAAISSVSAIQAISGDWVTSAANVITDPALAYFLVKDGDTSKWNGVDLSTLDKTYDVLSDNEDLLKVTSSVDDNNTTFTLSAKDWSDELDEKVDYDEFETEINDIADTIDSLSATVETDYVKKGEIPEPVFYDISAKYAKAQSGVYNDKDYYFISGAEIIGNNGISAEYDENTNSWKIGLEEQTYSYAEAQTVLTTLTASTEALSGYINIAKYGEGIEIDSTDITLDKGLYHVDIQVNVPVETVSNNTYSVSLTSNLSNAIVTHDIDTSYIHTETLDLSFDVNVLQNSDSLIFGITGLPAGFKYIVKNLQIHQVVTTDTVMDVAGHIYNAGDGILIDNQYNIGIDYDSTSGIGLNENNQLVVKLGKGLKFDDTGAAEGTLTLDNKTEEVVETVTELQTELDNKLTVNMPFVAATNFANPYDGSSETGGSELIAQLFYVPLQHKLYENESIISVYASQTMSQANTFPIVIGLFEYDFDYYHEDTRTYGQTNWVADTGKITALTPGKNDFPLIHISPTRNSLNSDKVYYAVIVTRSGHDGLNYFFCGDNYGQNSNANPVFSWGKGNMLQWYDDGTPTGATRPIDWSSDVSLENLNWWAPGQQASYTEQHSTPRFLMQVRNKKQV